MAKKLVIQLVQTFGLSLLLTGLLYVLFFGSAQGCFEGGQALTLLLFVGNGFLNFIMMIAALPVLFLANSRISLMPSSRPLFYFSGPVAMLFFLVLFAGHSTADRLMLCLPAASFLAIHTCFYFRLIKYQPPN